MFVAGIQHHINANASPVSSELLRDFRQCARDPSLTTIYRVLTPLRGQYRYRRTNEFEFSTDDEVLLAMVTYADGSEKIMGTLVFHDTGYTLYVSEFTTREGSHGYGRMLIEAAQSIVRTRDLDGIILCSTSSAEGFYLHFGFFNLDPHHVLHIGRVTRSRRRPRGMGGMYGWEPCRPQN